MFKAKKELWMIISALAVLIACFAPASFAAGERLSVQVDEPFEVGGHVFPGGELRLHEIGDYSPVATLNEVVVNGHSLGLLLARQTDDATSAPGNELVFSRGTEGHLVLDSVAFAGQPIRALTPLPGDADRSSVGETLELARR